MNVKFCENLIFQSQHLIKSEQLPFHHLPINIAYQFPRYNQHQTSTGIIIKLNGEGADGKSKSSSFLSGA